MRSLNSANGLINCDYDMRKCANYLILTLVMAFMAVTAMAATTWNGGRTDFRDETIYFVMPTRFYDGDSSNNTYCWDGAKDAAKQDPEWRGDFKGLIERLDYIKALGFTAIWITPVVQNASGFDYHGYHANDFSKVDQRFESGDCKFQDLIDAVHAHGMKIIVDIVINHTGNFGEEHLCKLFTRDYSKPQSDIDQCMVPFTIKDGGKLKDNYLKLPGAEQYADRLTKMKNTDGVNHDTHNLWHHYGNFNWDEPNRWWAQIAGDCVDLNTENPETTDYLIQCYGKFIEMGVDGFRIDTGGHISRLTFNKVFIPAFKELGERYKSKRQNQCPFFMYAEVCARFSDVTYRNQPSLSPYFYTWQSDASLLNQWNTNAAYWQGVSVFESTDPATLDNQKLCLTEHNNNLSESAQPRSNNAKLNGNTYHAPDHTQASGMSVIDFTAHWNFQNAGRLWGVLDKDEMYNDATYNVMYVESHDYGPDSFNRFEGGTSQWAENLSIMFTMRGIPCLFQGGEIEFRKGKKMDDGTNMALFDTGRAYYGGYLTGDVTAADFGEVANASGNVAATLSRPLVKHLQRLNKIRAAVPALRKGQYTKSDCSSNGGYAFKRRYTEGSVDSYVLVALNAGATFNNVLNGTYTDCVTGNTITVTNGTLTTESFSGKGNMRIYVLNGPGKIGEDGPFLYGASAVTPTQLAYDGNEEAGDPNTKYITGGGTGGDDTDIDDLEVYEPIVDENELSVFYESNATRGDVTVWAWNSSTNYTGGKWPGVNATLMGKTADGTRKIYKWTYDGTEAGMPTGLIFSNNGGDQTADLTYVNHGYYVDGVYNHTVTNTVQADPDAATLTITPDAGTYTDRVTVTITASKSDAVIVFTTDGSKPTTASAQAIGSKSLSLTATTTVRAGVVSNGQVVNTLSREYKIQSSQVEQLCAYFIAPQQWGGPIYCYAWNSDLGNKTYAGSWPGAKCTNIGTTSDGLAMWMWDGGQVGDDIPTHIIFNNNGGNGSNQTANFEFVNKGWYNLNGITTNPNPEVKGDVNGDGIVSGADVTTLYNVLLNGVTPKGNADVNGDGVVSGADVTGLYSLLLMQ